MPTRDVTLTEHLDRFVEEQVGTGRYQDADEVLRAGLRLLERQTRAEEEKLTLLRALASEGFRSLDQGEGLDLADEDELRSAIAAIGRKVIAKARSVD